MRERILRLLGAEGFPLAGSCSPRPDAASGKRLQYWLQRGFHAGMDYMSRTAAERLDLRVFLPWAEGVFVVALPYNTSRKLSTEWTGDGRGWISRYAWGRDYHKVLRKRLKKVAALLEAEGFKARVCVDTAPVLERSLAVRAGLGFIGKNGMLINREFGSYLFLGEIVTDLPLKDAESAKDGCGGCSLCLKACPTGAIVESQVLDARRCISYWTIEHRGRFGPETPDLHGNLFGCDICQEVCPWNKRAPLSKEPDFGSRQGLYAPRLDEIAAMNEKKWDELTRGSAVRRAGYEGLLRNGRRLEKGGS